MKAFLIVAIPVVLAAAINFIVITRKGFLNAKENNRKAKDNCTCEIEETTGWTEVKCCNVCGNPIFNSIEEYE